MTLLSWCIDLLTPVNVVAYLLFCMATYHFFINIRCKTLFRSTPELNAKYAPFARNDVENWGMFRMLPFYIFFWPKFILTMPLVGLTGLYYQIILLGHKQGTPISSIRKFLGRWVMRLTARLVMFLANIYWIKYEYVTPDWKKYLGPDWKPTFQGASTLVSNHAGWYDTATYVWLEMPSFLAKKSVARYLGVGPCSIAL